MGACVGMRGSRVKDIVNELKGERVDIVRWSDDIKEYVKASLSPAEPLEVTIDKTNKRIAVTVADDQLSIGIGKHGQNVRLASRLIGWEIDIRGKEEKAKKAAEALMAGKPVEKEDAVTPEAPKVKTTKTKAAKIEGQKEAFSLTEIKGIGQKVAKILIASGYDTLEKIKALAVEDLVKLEGVGEKTAEKILKAAKNI